jgi:hypothetical protein
MSTCEKCWGRAYELSRIRGTFQFDEYIKLIEDVKWPGSPCTPQERAGQFWDEETQSDNRAGKVTQLWGSGRSSDTTMS